MTRQLYYQQLKDNLLQYAQEVSEEQCFQLAAYSLQADLGNYQHDKHTTNYFNPRDYFPAWVSAMYNQSLSDKTSTEQPQKINFKFLKITNVILVLRTGIILSPSFMVYFFTFSVYFIREVFLLYHAI